MTDNYDDIFGVSSDKEKSIGGEFDDIFGINAPVPERTLGSNLKDTGISLVKGVVGAGQGIIGLADIPTGGRVGKGLEAIGINAEKTQEFLSEKLSPAQQAANLKVDSAKGFVNTAQAMLENPSTIAHGIVETLPSVAAGGVIGKGALALSSKLAPKAITTLGKTGSAIAASAVGEGAIAAGQTEEQIRNQTPDKLTTATQSSLAALSGLGTGIFGVVGGSLARKLKFADVDTMIINGLNPAKKEGLKGVAKSIIGGGITEGVFEELPQTIQETIFTNAALDKPLLEGVPEASAKAIILGGAMGGGANLLPGAKVGPVKTEEELAIENRAANILALDKDQFAAGTKKLADELQTNKELLTDVNKLDIKARELNIDPKELASKLVYDNKNNQALLDKVNAEVKVMEEVIKKKDAEEYAKLSPEEKVIKDVENKLIAQRIETAQKINDRLNVIEDQESTLLKQYNAEQNLEKKKVIASQITAQVLQLRKEKDILLERQRVEVNKKDFMSYSTREDRQKGLEETFGTANRTFPSDKDAAESAKVFEEELSSKNIADYVNHINNVKEVDRKQYLDQLLDKVGKEKNITKAIEYADYIKNNAIDQREYPGSFREKVDNFLINSRKETYVTTMPGPKVANPTDQKDYILNSAEESAKALYKAGMFKGQVSSFTDERQVPLTDNQQIIVDKNNVEIAKLTEKWNSSVDRDQRIDLLNKIDALEKDNALIRTSVEQFDALEEPANTWYSVLEQAVTNFQQKQATPDQWKGMIKNVPGIKQEELDWIGLNEWLDGQKGKVSKDALMNFIQANNVQLEEVTKGGTRDYISIVNEKLIPLGYKYVVDTVDSFTLKDIVNDKLIESGDILPNSVLDILDDEDNFKENDPTKFSQYQLPGGKNYKEILLTIKKPTKDIYAAAREMYGKPWRELSTAEMDHVVNTVDDPNRTEYQSAHWDEPNILAHIRFNERIDSEGNKVLFLEEVQSDWHQAGRKSGYKNITEESVDTSKWKLKKDIAAAGNVFIEVYDDKNKFITAIPEDLSDIDAINRAKKIYVKEFNSNNDNAVPDAPFKKSWLLLAMKRMIRYAAENGFDKIAWTTGEQQADRYDLSKQIDNIYYEHLYDGDLGWYYNIVANKDGRAVLDERRLKPDQIEKFLGKELTEKIVKSEKEQGLIKGDDLKIGGEGMKGFYDKILPAMLNNEFNKGKWGNAKVGQIDVGLQKDGKVTKEEAIKAFYDGKFVFIGSEFAQSQSEIMKYQGEDLTTVMPDEVLSLPITERMKAKALGEGMPMFELANGQAYNPSASVKQETNLGNILTAVKSAEGLTGQLANFISEFIPESKLDIKVIIDPTAKSASYLGGQVNTITLRDPSQLTSSIHEITHAVTVREMIEQEKELLAKGIDKDSQQIIRNQVKLLIARVKSKAIKEAILTPEQIRLLETERTSLGYKENITGNVKFENVAYGLLNEYEFLAQAMGNSQFQELLKATTIADKGVLRNAWDAFVELVMKALGIKDTSKNAFGEALSIIAKLASQENINQFSQGSNESLADATSRIQNLPAFKKWFGDSKVVDENGDPLVVYHGTAGAEITEFDISKAGSRDTGFYGTGFYFTPDEEYASTYPRDKFVNGKLVDPAPTTDRYVMHSYVALKNPLIVNKPSELYKIAGTDKGPEISVQLKKLGYDGVIKLKDGVIKEIVAFYPTQIKSIFNNKWNGSNPDINESYDSLEVEQRLPQSEYDAVYAEKNNRLSDFVQNAGIKYHEVKLLADKAFGSISTRLKKVDPELSEHLRWLDFKTSQKIIDILRTAKPLLEATKVMSPEDKSEWNWARLNSDTGKIERIESKYGLADQVKLLREKIDQIRTEAIEVGYDVGFIEDYWPRVIKDTEGFLQATQGISQRAEFTEAIRDKAKELGITQKQFEREYPELKADIISNMILGRYYGIGGPGNIKARVFETIDPKYAKFYMDADASLMQYVYSMTKKIEARRFFGKVPERISNLKSSRNKKQADLIKFTQLAEMARADNPEAFADYSERITGLNEDITRFEQELNKYKHTNDYTENIGAYIDEMRITGRIQPKDEKTVKDILMARFNEQGTHGVVNTFKNASYIDVMANFSSAITQIGDLAWAMYVGKVWTPSGFLGTGKNLFKAISGSFDVTKDRFGKSEVTKEDLGFERIAQEFADGTTLGRAVSKAFKWVQLERIDSIGKEVLINNALDQYKAEAKRNPEALAAKIKPTFGNKSIDVVQEILADVPSDNVKMLLYSKVLDFQPAALSEMPEYYLTAGNGRVFYMLKTYTLKQMDVFRREVVHNLKSEDPKQKIQGLTNMFNLLVLLSLANAGADELKDLMLGKETRFSDNVIDNFLVMGGASRYTQMQISKEGFGSAMLQQVLPPMKFINSASKDLHEGYKNYVSGDTSSFDHARIIDSIPLAGKLYYWHYGRGEENKKSLAEKDFSDATKAADLFKKQLENYTDKRTFIEANLDRFKQMKLQENFQAALNRNKAVINKLEKLPSTENVQTRLGQLKDQREQILKKYLDVAKTIQ